MGQSGDMDDTAAIDVKAKELEATMQRLRETREKLLQVVSESKADPSLNPRAGPLKTKAVALAIDSALAELQQMTLASSLGELRQGSHISQDSLPGELVEKDPLAVEAGQRQVNLAMLQLTSIPTPIFQIKTITMLDLSHNNLTVFPKELSSLTNLSQLDMSHNALTTLPSALSRMMVLTQLSLAYNKISAFDPNWSFGLAPMLDLDLSHNELPDAAFAGVAMAAALVLRKLNLSHNKLTTVPVSVCRSCRELRSLHLDHNEITSASDELAKLVNLRYLTLSHNKLQFMPTQISYLNNLLGLSLAHNSLSAPPALRATLRVVHLEGNPYQGA